MTASPAPSTSGPTPCIAGGGGLPLVLRNLRLTLADGGQASRFVLNVPALDIPASAQLAICGPSGSGKTTLLNVLAAIQCPDSGSVHWGHEDVAAMSAGRTDRWRRETLGFVFQDFHLFAGLSALANVLLPLQFDHLLIGAAMKHDASALLDRVDIPAHARVERLSRGEMQRVAVARALIRAPKIVLADEPTASLDRTTARLVTDLLCRLCRECGATLIVVTHDDELANRLDRRVCLPLDEARPLATTMTAPELSPA